MNMETLLRVEIEDRLVELSKLDPASKEYSAASNSITTLMDRLIELEKLDAAEVQNEQKLKEDRKSLLVKSLIDIGGIVLPLAVTIWGAKASFRFEETGTITSAAGRQFLQKIFKK